jgi:hypothetical protein
MPGQRGRFTCPTVSLVSRYVIRADDLHGEVLSRHRTRQGAIDTWRERHSGRRIVIVRTDADGTEVVVVEGIRHDGPNWRD